MGIVTLTMNPAVDVAATVDRVTATRKLRCHKVRRDPGGGGINVARAVHFLGGEALALFPAGGATGQLLQQLLRDEEVAFRAHETAGLCRESFTVLEEASGSEYRFVLPGPTLEDEAWRGCLRMLEDLSPFRYLVASGSLPPGAPEDFYGRVARWARQNSVRLVLDTSGAALRAALEEGVYLVKPNRRELQELSGKTLKEPGEQEEASRRLIADGACEAIALTLGADGALLVWAQGARRVAVPEVDVKSAVGAGDSFVAGLVLGLVRGLALPEAFCYGTAAGTAALLTPGTELCRRDDTDRLFHRICSRNS